ncbi:MAG: DUF4383 domain-containing protein [Bdellovibrionota bacterium]
MHPKQFALIGGIVMLVFGAVAFIPALSTSPADAGLPLLNLETSYGLFLDIFPMNVMNKLALVIFGLAGIWSANRATTNLPASINFSRWVFAVMGVAAILGLFTQTDTLGSYWPLFGAEVPLHAVFAALGAYFGFVLPARASKEISDRFPDEKRRAG